MLSWQRKANQKIRMDLRHNKTRIKIRYSRRSCSFTSSRKWLMKQTKRKHTFYSGCKVQNSYSIKIQNWQDYLSIKNDPIKLLKTIEIHSLTYEENRYDVRIIDGLLKNLININQKDDDSLINYTARFESVKDIAVAHLGGPIVVLKIFENDTSSTTKQGKTTTA